jgi:hypothetical protein
MENETTIVPVNSVAKKEEVNDFGKILLRFGITYKIESPWLVIGKPSDELQWIFYLSFLHLNADKLIEKVVPVLDREGVAYKIIQNYSLISKLNGFWFGIYEAGKVITIYTSTVKTAKRLLKELKPLTQGFSGPVVPGAIRLDEIIYAKYGQDNGTGHDDSKETKPASKNFYIKKHPFSIPKIYRVKKRKQIIGKFYVPIRLIRANPKGDLILGVNIKNWAFTKCLIKQARGNSSFDDTGIEIAHKLFWQKKVIQQLQGTVRTPKLLDFCKLNNDYYLITEFIEGPNLNSKIKELHKGESWINIDNNDRIKILNIFLDIVNIVKCIHLCGYVHRDITDTNFIVSEDGIVYIIDFELSYSVIDSIPFPAFTLGTIGFASPEQLAVNVPTPFEDIYSLGTLLLFMITNTFPGDILKGENINEGLLELIGNKTLVEVIQNTTLVDPSKRLDIDEIINLIEKVIKEITSGSNIKIKFHEYETK